jgi:hypothetical protein
MKKGRFNEEQIIGILKQHEAGRKVADLAREHGVGDATIYTWKGKYGGMLTIADTFMRVCLGLDVDTILGQPASNKIPRPDH